MASSTADISALVVIFSSVRPLRGQQSQVFNQPVAVCGLKAGPSGVYTRADNENSVSFT